MDKIQKNKIKQQILPVLSKKIMSYKENKIISEPDWWSHLGEKKNVVVVNMESKSFCR